MGPQGVTALTKATHRSHNTTVSLAESVHQLMIDALISQDVIETHQREVSVVPEAPHRITCGDFTRSLLGSAARCLRHLQHHPQAYSFPQNMSSQNKKPFDGLRINRDISATFSLLQYLHQSPPATYKHTYHNREFFYRKSFSLLSNHHPKTSPLFQ